MSLVLVDTKKADPIKYASLIEEKVGIPTLTTIVENLEEETRTLKNRCRKVENKVMGSNITTGLIEQGTPAPISLESRLSSLWLESKALKETAHKLEKKFFR